MSSKLAFLSSTRFWALVVGAVLFYLQSKGILGDAEMILANTIIDDFITIKTVDRNLGDANSINLNSSRSN